MCRYYIVDWIQNDWKEALKKNDLISVINKYKPMLLKIDKELKKVELYDDIQITGMDWNLRMDPGLTIAHFFLQNFFALFKMILNNEWIEHDNKYIQLFINNLKWAHETKNWYTVYRLYESIIDYSLGLARQQDILDIRFTYDSINYENLCEIRCAQEMLKPTGFWGRLFTAKKKELVTPPENHRRDSLSEHMEKQRKIIDDAEERLRNEKQDLLMLQRQFNEDIRK